MIMKKIFICFISFSLLLILFLPFVVLAEEKIASCVCSNGTCDDFTTMAEANVKCKSQDTVICKVMGGNCSNKNSSPTPKESSAPASKPNSKDVYIKLDNPLGGVKTPTDIIGQVIKVAMSVMGGAVLLMVVKGATTWITAAGNAENIESGTKTIIWAIVGAILTVGSYVVLSGIMNAYFHPLAQK